MLRWLLRKTVKPITIRVRWYLQADIMAELAVIRTQLGMPDNATGPNLASTIQSVENALLTVALLGGESKQGHGSLPRE